MKILATLGLAAIVTASAVAPVFARESSTTAPTMTPPEGIVSWSERCETRQTNLSGRIQKMETMREAQSGKIDEIISKMGEAVNRFIELGVDGSVMLADIEAMKSIHQELRADHDAIVAQAGVIAALDCSTIDSATFDAEVSTLRSLMDAAKEDMETLKSYKDILKERFVQLKAEIEQPAAAEATDAS